MENVRRIIKFNNGSLVFQLLLSNMIEIETEKDREYLDKIDVEKLIQFLNEVKEELN